MHGAPSVVGRRVLLEAHRGGAGTGLGSLLTYLVRIGRTTLEAADIHIAPVVLGGRDAYTVAINIHRRPLRPRPGEGHVLLAALGAAAALQTDFR